MEKKRIQWHSCFSAALRITLGDEMEHLEMQEEYLLSRKPLQMDILIIKNSIISKSEKKSEGYSESIILSNISLRKTH